MAKGTISYGAVNQTHTVALNGASDAQIDVSGAFVATINFKASFDGGATFVPWPVVKADGSISTSTTAAGGFRALKLPPNATHLQTQVPAYTSGAPVVNITTL